LTFVSELLPCQDEPTEEEVGQHRGGHASNNLAKLPFLFETTVPRARLRPKYGQGFGRKSGRVTAKRVTPGR